MGKRKNKRGETYTEVNCSDCLYLIINHLDLINKTHDCVLLREKVRGKVIKEKHRRKLKKALTRFAAFGKTQFCRFFKPFKPKELCDLKNFGKKAHDFIEGRYDESAS